MAGFVDTFNALADKASDYTPYGIASDFIGGVVAGDDAVEQQAKNEDALTDVRNSDFVQDNGLDDIYDGVTEFPGVGDVMKPQESLDNGATKLGASIHDGASDAYGGFKGWIEGVRDDMHGK